MNAALFADADGTTGRTVQLTVNVLAVGGSFLVGQVLTAAVVWVFDKWLLRSKSPPGLKRFARVVGGLAAAVLAALVLFGHGSGWTILGGGGTGTSNDHPTPGTGRGSADHPSAPPTEPKSPASPTARSPAPVGERIRVALLGGEDVKDERFYLIDDDATPKTFGEAKAAITARKEAAGKPLGVEVRFTANNTLPPNHPAVLQLTHWAQSNGMPVTLPADAP